MKIKIGKDIVSFPTVRRGSWDIKVSSGRGNQFLVIAQHYQNKSFTMKMCYDQTEVVNYINFLEEKDEV